jgi:CheY-like chemotaxis protein
MTKSDRPQHIFVINDEPVLLALFQELLADEGYTVTLETFNQASMDLQYVRIVEARPDLIVLDFLIGGEMLGWQFLQMLRMQRQTAKVPIVVCTAAANTVKELAAHLAEMRVGVVLKPFAIDDLLAEVRKQLHAAPDDPWAPAAAS